MKSVYMMIAALVVVAITGCDDDESMVNDDSQSASIDTYIAANVPDVPGARAKAREYVDALSDVEKTSMNVEGARAFLGKLSAIGICFDESLEASNTSADIIIQDLKARTLNTKARADAYLALNALMGNTVTSLEEVQGMALYE